MKWWAVNEILSDDEDHMLMQISTVNPRVSSDADSDTDEILLLNSRLNNKTQYPKGSQVDKRKWTCRHPLELKQR